MCCQVCLYKSQHLHTLAHPDGDKWAHIPPPRQLGRQTGSSAHLPVQGHFTETLHREKRKRDTWERKRKAITITLLRAARLPKGEFLPIFLLEGYVTLIICIHTVGTGTTLRGWSAWAGKPGRVGTSKTRNPSNLPQKADVGPQHGPRLHSTSWACAVTSLQVDQPQRAILSSDTFLNIFAMLGAWQSTEEAPDTHCLGHQSGLWACPHLAPLGQEQPRQ